MKMLRCFPCFLILLSLHISLAQVPPRLQIPGAIPLQNDRRQQRINAADFITRPRRPLSNASPPSLREVRPVVEEEQENYPSISSFDTEVNKFSIPALSSAVRQAEEQEESTLRPSPLPFRPERPIPVTRDQIRERPVEAPSPRPVIRQEVRNLPAFPQNRPIQKPFRPVVRQELDEDEDELPPIRQQGRPKVRQQQQQQFRPAPQRPAARPQYDDDDRNKKPVVQILRKYRTDNPDGTITWGFENDDGTFKEETLGIDCTIKGKYGYIDPEGTRREYEYEAGNKCDPNQERIDEEEEEERAARIPSKQAPSKGKPQLQYRPQPLAQY